MVLSHRRAIEAVGKDWGKKCLGQRQGRTQGYPFRYLLPPGQGQDGPEVPTSENYNLHSNL
jgi:hypothetical protein